MPALTSSDLAAQCLAGSDDAWRRFITRYMPFAAAILDRYRPDAGTNRREWLEKILASARGPDAGFFREYQGQSEREFLLHLREHVLTAAPAGQLSQDPPSASPLDWEVFEKALSGLTALERQIVWTSMLSPAAGDADKVLRLDPATVLAVMSKAQELLRDLCGMWSDQMLGQNRVRLAQRARLSPAGDCPVPRLYLRMLDGQITWRDRSELEQHLCRCWYCVDILCRFREVTFLWDQAQPLLDSDAQAYCQRLGLRDSGASRWRWGASRRRQ